MRRERRAWHQAFSRGLLVIAIVAVLLPWTGTDARAAGEVLTLVPDSGGAGDQITVTGSGWLEVNGPVYVFSDPSQAVDLNNALTSAAPDGTNTISSQLTLPNLTVGAHRFFACQVCVDSGRGFPLAHASFRVTTGEAVAAQPALTLDPSEGHADSSVTVSGTGWDAGLGDVSIFASEEDSLDPGNAIAIAAPDDAGDFETKWTVTDDLAATSYEFYACQACDDIELILEDTAPFTVTEVPVSEAQLSLDPQTGEPGDRVSVSGTGWSAEAGPVSIFSDDSQSGDQANALTVATPDGNGVISDFFRVPDLSEADYQFYACQACDDPNATVSDEAAFTIRGGGSGQSNGGGSYPLIALIVGGLLLLLLLLLAAAAAYHYRRRAVLRRPSFKPRPDPAFEVQLWPDEGPSLPRLRLVPHDDESATTKVIKERR